MPSSGPDTGMPQWCLLCGAFGLSDAIGNAMLFAPLGIGLCCSGVSGRRAVALGLLLSAAIECVQLRVVPGREAALGDVVSNTLGAGLGVALAGWLPARRRSGLRSLAAAVAAAAIIAGTGLVLRPSFPPTTYYGQWTANLGQYEWYRGRVRSAEIGGIPLPSWRLADSRTVRQRLAEGTPLSVRAIAGPRTERLAPLFSIYDGHRREILLVGPDRDDLVLQVRARAVDLLFRQPGLRWRGAMAGFVAGDTLSVGVYRTRRGYCLRLNGRERCRLAYTAGRAWGLVQVDPHLPVAAQTVLDWVFMAMLGLPLGAVFRRSRSGYVAAAIAIAGATALPSLIGLAPTPPLQLVALGAGILAGALAP